MGLIHRFEIVSLSLYKMDAIIAIIVFRGQRVCLLFLDAKQPTRYRPGMAALREIRKYKKSTELVGVCLGEIP